MEKTHRLIGLDSLRVTMIILVIALHAGMTYMVYSPDWWYVHDSRTNIGFTSLVIVLDTFPMTVLFFLSGFFAYKSFKKRGFATFIKDKLLHIGVPWILGVLFVAPFFSRASFISLGYPSIPIVHYFKEYFFSDLYQQAHYWFLGILFLFFLVYTFIPKKKLLTDLNPLLLIGLTIIITFISYYFSSTLYKPASDWSNIGFILYFQPARIIGYASMFALGVYASNHHWFKAGGWSPNNTYLYIGIVSIVLLVYWKMLLAHKLSPSINLLLDALSYSITSICSTFGLIILFIKESTKSRYSLSKISPYSYGIYWLHQIVLMANMTFLLYFTFSPSIKWSIAILVTFVVCLLITKYVLKRVPLLRKIF